MVRQLNALIVDDCPNMRNLIMRLLGRTALADFTFTEAADGLDALEAYVPGETEIIFVDMNMPRMGGLEFVRTLRERHAKRPTTVMITAETRRDRLNEAFSEKGVDAILLKPVDRDRLQDGLRKIVDAIPERSGPSAVPHGECVPQAVEEVFAQVCGIELERDSEDEAVRRNRVVLGMITVHGSVHWSVAIGFPWRVAILAATRFAGCEIGVGGVELGDAVGELVNIIGGRIKQKLGAKGLTVNFSLPTVLEACDFEVLLEHNVSEYTHFRWQAGRLWSRVAVGMEVGAIL